MLLLHLLVVRVVGLLRFFDPLRRAFDYGVSDCFLHQVDLTLANELHMRVSEWNQ